MQPQERDIAYVDWVLEAKRPETRARRVKEAVTRLSRGKGHFYQEGGAGRMRSPP